MIGIIDYGMGNLRSVQKALERVGAEAMILTRPGQLGEVDKLVLPGVGAFADGIDQLQQRGWVDPVRAYIDAGRPMLGICLGMQLLFEASEEDAPVPGLAVLPGRVVRFSNVAPDGTRLKVPQMGWNALDWTRPDPLLARLSPGESVYFVHGYYAQPRESGDAPVTSATADYGGPFCASIWRGNLWATQFHPEKSQRVGLTILENFVAVEV
ncbi:MAG: imidazole glycerol phosphate synthase subunit HisH [Phycisphaeraceae bacterium]